MIVFHQLMKIRLMYYPQYRSKIGRRNLGGRLERDEDFESYLEIPRLDM
jgi:hypothetical protein